MYQTNHLWSWTIGRKSTHLSSTSFFSNRCSPASAVYHFAGSLRKFGSDQFSNPSVWWWPLRGGTNDGANPEHRCHNKEHQKHASSIVLMNLISKYGPWLFLILIPRVWIGMLIPSRTNKLSSPMFPTSGTSTPEVTVYLPGFRLIKFDGTTSGGDGAAIAFPLQVAEF